MSPRTIVAALALATGCASTRADKARAEAGRLAAERIDRQVSWEQGTPEDEAVQRRVRELLSRPLTPDAAVEIALVRNPELLATLEDLGIAQADLVQASLPGSVHVGGGPRFALSGASGVGWEGDVGFNFLELVLIPLRRKAAKAGLQAATLDVAQHVLELDVEVRKAVVEAVAAERTLALLRARAELAEAAAELATIQVGAGVAGTLNELEQGELRSDEAEARMALQHAHVHVVDTREQLVRLLGLWGEDVGFSLPAALPKLPAREPDLSRLERIAVRQRFDLQAQRAQVEALADAVKLARAVPFVDVEIGAIGEADPGDGPTLGPFFELEVPVFDWGQAEIARAEAMLRQVERRLRGRAIDARSEVRVARARLVAERRLVEYERDVVVPLRERMTALGQERYDAMLLGAYELIEVKQHELMARAELVEHLLQYWIARADLELAVGGRLTPRRRPRRKE